MNRLRLDLSSFRTPTPSTVTELFWEIETDHDRDPRKSMGLTVSKLESDKTTSNSGSDLVRLMFGRIHGKTPKEQTGVMELRLSDEGVEILEDGGRRAKPVSQRNISSQIPAVHKLTTSPSQQTPRLSLRSTWPSYRWPSPRTRNPVRVRTCTETPAAQNTLEHEERTRPLLA